MNIKELIGRILYGRQYGYGFKKPPQTDTPRPFPDITDQLRMVAMWSVSEDKGVIEIEDAEHNNLGDVSFDDDGNLVLINFSTGENTIQLARLVEIFIEAQKILIEWHDDDPPLPKGNLIKVPSDCGRV